MSRNPGPDHPPAGAPISFKTVPGRHRTQKWNKAANYSYDGDDWGGYDPYDEYGYDDQQQQQATPPMPAQSSQLPSQRTRQRSFDQGDDGARSVSAPTAHNDDRRGGPGLNSTISGVRGSNDFPRSSSRPRDFTSTESAPPPMMLHDAPAPSGWFPPRRSSLKGDTYETQQQAAEARAIAESVTNPATNIGAADTEKPLPFIRPSDIYKRMEEEKRRESEESARPSIDSLQKRGSMDRKLDLTPVQEHQESRLFADDGDQRLENSISAVNAQDTATKDTSPTLPLLTRFSGFGDDFLTQSVLRKNEEISSSLQSGQTLNADALSEAQMVPGSLQQTPIATKVPPEQATAADIRAERQQESESLQHQPSVGLRSAVHKAFDTGDASLSRDSSTSYPSGSGIGRSDTSATGSISPIMSRVPATGIAASGQQAGSGQVPPVVEETPREHNPAMFEPGYRRSLDPPSTGTSPARTPNLETTEGKRLSTPMSALVGDGEAPDIRDQGAEVVGPVAQQAPTPVGELPPLETKSLPQAGRGRSGTDYSVRESDIADTINASPDKDPISPELAEASKDSRDLFLATHDIPAASSPLTPGGTARVSTSRAGSPTKGRVREIANRYHEMHDASRRNSATSLGSSKSSWSRFGDDDNKQRSERAVTDPAQSRQQPEPDSSAGGLSAPRPELDREVSFEPDLPGGWINSSAPTPAVEEPPAAKLVESVSVEKGSPTPIDLTPTTRKYQLREFESGDNASRSPIDGAKDIGNQLAASIVSSYGVGHQTRDFGSAEPAPPVDQLEMLPQRTYGDVSLAPPLLRHETESSDGAPTSVASSTAPTPIAKDTAGPRSGLSTDDAEYFHTVAPLRVRSREPSPEHARPASTAPQARQQHLSQTSSDNGEDNEENDRLRREIVASLEDDTARTQDALDAPDNACKITQRHQPLPESEAGLLEPGTEASSIAAGVASRTTSPPPNQGLLTTRFSWEAPAPVTAEKALPQSPGIKPEAAYERQRSSRLHIMNPEAGELSPDTPVKPPSDAARMSTNGPLAVPDLSRPEAAAAEEGIVRSLSQRVQGLGVQTPVSPVTQSQGNTVAETTTGPDSPLGSLREFKPPPDADLPPEKDWTNSSPMPAATSPIRPKSAGKIPPFRTILNMKTPEERIKAYTETRQTFAEMNTGLSDWLTAMSSKQPDVFDAAESSKPLPVQTAPGMAGANSWKRGHRPAPSIAGFKNRFASGGSATAEQQGRRPSIGVAGGPALDASDTARPATGSTASGGIDMDRVQQQMQARGKEFMKNSKVLGGKASAGAKGLLAKGRSRFGGGGGSVRGKSSEVTSSPPPSSSLFGSKFLKKRPASGSFGQSDVATSAPAVDTVQTAKKQSEEETTSPDPPVARTKPTAEQGHLAIDNEPLPKIGDGFEKDHEGSSVEGVNKRSAVMTAKGPGVDVGNDKVPVLDVKPAELERPQAPTPIEMLTDLDKTALAQDVTAVHDMIEDSELRASTLPTIVDRATLDTLPITTAAPSEMTPVVPVPVVPSRRSSHTLPASLQMPSDKRADMSRHTSASSISAFLRRDGASTPSSGRSGSRPWSQVFERLREKGRSISRSRMEGSRSRPASLVLSQSNLLSDEYLAEPKTAVLVADKDIIEGQHAFDDFDSSSAPDPFTINSLGDVAIDPAWKPESDPTASLHALASTPRVEAWNAPDAQLPPKYLTGRSTQRNIDRLGVLPSPAPTTTTFAEGERHASLTQSRRRSSAAAGRGEWRRGLEERYGGELEPVDANLGNEEEEDREETRPVRLGFITGTAENERKPSEQTSDRAVAWKQSASIMQQQHQFPEEEDASTAATAPSQRPQQQRKISDISTLPSQQRRASETQTLYSPGPAGAVFSSAGSLRLINHSESNSSHTRPGSLAAILPSSSGDLDGVALRSSPEGVHGDAEDAHEEYKKMETAQPEDLLPPSLRNMHSASASGSKGLNDEQEDVERLESQPERPKPSTRAVNLASLIASATARRAQERDVSSSAGVARPILIEAQPNPFVLSQGNSTAVGSKRHSSAELWEDARSEVSDEDGTNTSLRREKTAGVASGGSSISSLGHAGDDPALHADPARAPQMHAGDVAVAQDGAERVDTGQQRPYCHNRSANQPLCEAQQRSTNLLRASHPGIPDRPLSYVLSPRDSDGLAQESLTTGKDATLSASKPVDLSLVSGPPVGTRPFQQHPVFRISTTSTGGVQSTDYERMRSTSRLSGVLMSPSLDGVDDKMEASRPHSGFFRGGAGTPSASDAIPSRDTISDLHGLEDVHAWGVDTAPSPHGDMPSGTVQRPDSKQGGRRSGIWQAFSRRRSSTQATDTGWQSTSLSAVPPPFGSLENTGPDKVPAQPLSPIEQTTSAKKQAKTLQKPQRTKSMAMQIKDEETQRKRFSGFKSLLGRSSTSAMPKSQAEDKNIRTRPEPAKKLRKMAPTAIENARPLASPPLYQGRPTNPSTVLGVMSGYGEYEAARRREMARAAFGTPPPLQPPYQAPPPSEPPADGWYGPSSPRQAGEGAHREIDSIDQIEVMPDSRRLQDGGSGQGRAITTIPEAFRPVEAGFAQNMSPDGPPQGQSSSVHHHHQDLQSQREVSPPKARDLASVPGIQTSQAVYPGRVVSAGTELARSPAKEYGDQQTPYSIMLPQSEARSRQSSYGTQYNQQRQHPHDPPPGTGPESYQRRHSDVSRHSQEQYYIPHPADARFYNDRGPYPSPPFSHVSAPSPSPTQIRSPNWMSRQTFSQAASADYSHPSQTPMYQAAVTSTGIGPQWHPRQQPPARRASHQSQHSRPPPAGTRYYQHGPLSHSQQFGALQSPYQRHYSGGQEPTGMGQRRPSGGYSGRRDDMTVGEEGGIMRGASYPGQEWVPPNVQFEEERRWR